MSRSMQYPGPDHSFGSHTRMVPSMHQETAERPSAAGTAFTGGSSAHLWQAVA